MNNNNVPNNCLNTQFLRETCKQVKFEFFPAGGGGLDVKNCKKKSKKEEK